MSSFCSLKNSCTKDILRASRSIIVTFFQRYKINTLVYNGYDRFSKTGAQLSQRQQEVLHLKFYAGLSYSQIAEVLNLKKDNVSYHIRQAFEKLRQVMGR
ncbi:RNA polymerase sigma factor [Sinomicrobium soli]|uniref:RNA polymerase sigma factor n=1 Tax=Sinomicrobium sp. N-1-3-6 TaxID=2219864 RepID=UPI00397AC2D3